MKIKEILQELKLSREAQQYLDFSGDKILDDVTIGDYELFLVKSGMIPNTYQIAFQRKGFDALNPEQQSQQQIQNRGKGSRKELTGVIDKWVRQYGPLIAASFNPEKTQKYVNILNRFGYKIGQKNFMGVELPTIQAPLNEKMLFDTDSKTRDGSGAWIAPNGKIFWVGFHGHEDFILEHRNTIQKISPALSKLFPQHNGRLTFDEIVSLGTEDVFQQMIKSGWMAASHGAIELFELSQNSLDKLKPFVETAWKAMHPNIILNTAKNGKYYNIPISDLLSGRFNQQTSEEY